MKKIASVLLIVALLFCAVASAEIAKEDMKIGLICLHDENMGYDANFIDSMKQALVNLGMDEFPWCPGRIRKATASVSNSRGKRILPSSSARKGASTGRRLIS